MVRRRGQQTAVFLAAVRAMDRRAGRGAPVRDSFFRHAVDGQTRYPLAQLMSSRRGASGGGRGGKTRLALYLSLLWVASGEGHASHRSARFWADLLDLPDPEHAGSRTVRSTWSELAARNLVSITKSEVAGNAPTVRLLREDGSGQAYTIPVGRDGDTYRRVPEEAWRSLLPNGELTGAGLVMYLVAIRTAGQAGRLDGLTFPRAYFKTEYGLGESTRRSGLRNLTDLGVLQRHTRHVDDSGDLLERRRQRDVFDLSAEYVYDPEQDKPSTPPAGQGARA
jgi:hypothetical protein